MSQMSLFEKQTWQTRDTSKTLDEAKEELAAALSKGTRCQCCGQFAKTYKRKLTATMARGLLKIYVFFEQNPNSEWVHIHNLRVCNSNEGALLRHWGLIAKKIDVKEDGNPNTGYYKLTELGRQFVENKVAIPTHIFTYDNNLLGYSEEKEYISGAFWKNFNYREIMEDFRCNQEHR